MILLVAVVRRLTVFKMNIIVTSKKEVMVFLGVCLSGCLYVFVCLPVSNFM